MSVDYSAAEVAGPIEGTLVDGYRGAGVADGSKSLAYALPAPCLRLRATKCTHVTAEAKTAAVKLAALRYGAVLRECECRLGWPFGGRRALVVPAGRDRGLLDSHRAKRFPVVASHGDVGVEKDVAECAAKE